MMTISTINLVVIDHHHHTHHQLNLNNKKVNRSYYRLINCKNRCKHKGGVGYTTIRNVRFKIKENKKQCLKTVCVSAYLGLWSATPQLMSFTKNSPNKKIHLDRAQPSPNYQLADNHISRLMWLPCSNPRSNCYTKGQDQQPSSLVSTQWLPHSINKRNNDWLSLRTPLGSSRWVL